MTAGACQPIGTTPEYIIVFGATNLGIRVSEFLAETGSEVLLVSDDSKALQQHGLTGIKTEYADFGAAGFIGKLELDRAAAIILALEDEKENLRLAVSAVELNPRLNIVIRLFNMNLAAKLQQCVKAFKVLSVSSVSAPTFALSAILEKSVFSLRNECGCFSVYEVVVMDRGETVSVGEYERQNDLKVLACGDRIFPEADEDINPDDSLLVFSEFGRARLLSPLQQPDYGGKKERDTGRRGVWQHAWPADLVLISTVCILIVTVVFSVSYFHMTEQLSLMDSLYFVVTVLTTVGFGDISLKGSSDISKLVGMGLMLSGVVLSAILFAIITDALIRKRLDLLMGRKKTGLNGHIILCGLGDVGSRILDEVLALGEKVIVLEKNPENRFLHSLRERNVSFIVADATQEDSLRLANIFGAKAIISATEDDLRNLEIGLNARGLTPEIRVVLRTFDRDFAQKIERYFNIHVAVSSSYIAAPVFASAACSLDVINRLRYHGSQLVIHDSDIPPDSLGTKILLEYPESDTGPVSEGPAAPSRRRFLYIRETHL